MHAGPVASCRVTRVRCGSPGKGLRDAQAVADILRDAGYDQRAQVVGLLHDVVEDTPRSIQDVRDSFGETIAAMVQALTEDDSIHNYAQRKRDLRAQVIGAGTTIMDIAPADKIAACSPPTSARPPSSTSSPRTSDHAVEGIAEHAAPA